MTQAAWIWWLGGGVLALTGLVLLWWSLFRDRARGRRRCPKCWYDMTGVPELVCPECGRDARREKRLGKTRRRWRAAIAACLITAPGVGMVAIPRASRDGWLSLVPTTVLLVTAPPAGQGYARGSTGGWVLDPIVAELKRRDAQSTLADWQWSWYISNRGVIEFPDRWPADTPLQVVMHEPEWFDYAAVEFLPSPESRSVLAAVGLTEYGASFSGMSVDGIQHIPTELGESGTVALHARVFTHQSGSSLLRAPPTQILWEGSISQSIRVVPNAREMFMILESPDWDAIAQECITPSIDIRVSEQYPGVYCTWVMDRSPGSGLEDAAIGFELQLLSAGEVRSRSLIEADDCDGYEAVGPKLRGGVHSYPKALASEIADDPAQWTLRVVGRPDLAIGDFRRSKAWSGSFELPLDGIVEIHDQ